MRVLIFDTETNGLPDFKAAPNAPQQPRVIQLAYGVWELNEGILSPLLQEASYVFHKWLYIPKSASDVNGITQEMCERLGGKPIDVFQKFRLHANEADVIIAYNNAFDNFMMRLEFSRLGFEVAKSGFLAEGKKVQYLCAMKPCTLILKLPPTERQKQYGYTTKPPKLQEAYQYFFKKPFDEAHDALADVNATARVVQELITRGALKLGMTDE